MAELYDKDGAVVEGAMLPDEVMAKVTEAVTAKETEFNGIKTTLETELDGTKKRLAERSSEFAHFRKLSEDDKKKLSTLELQLYENQEVQENERVAREAQAKEQHEKNVESFIRTKSGTDEKLFAKMKEMWGVFGVNAVTPEEMEQKSKMIIGAIGNSEPDLLASIGGINGAALAPGQGQNGQKEEKKDGFGTTDAGKGLASDIGIVIEKPKTA